MALRSHPRQTANPVDHVDVSEVRRNLEFDAYVVPRVSAQIPAIRLMVTWVKSHPINSWTDAPKVFSAQERISKGPLQVSAWRSGRIKHSNDWGGLGWEDRSGSKCFYRRGCNKYFWSGKLNFEKWEINFVAMVSLSLLNFLLYPFCCLDKVVNVKTIQSRRKYGEYLNSSLMQKSFLNTIIKKIITLIRPHKM